jgi:hypothetical protein
MAAIALRIVQPVHDAVFVAGNPIACRGEAVVPAELTDRALYYRWYSSLNPEAKENRSSLNDAALTNVSAVYSPPVLPLGSQAIVLAVSDRPGQTKADLLATRAGGATGGRQGPSRCVIHVVQASVLAPASEATISASSLKLKAKAPWAWGENTYHEVNRLTYRWSLTPVAPANGPTFTSPNLGRSQLTFDKSDSSVSYEPRLANTGYRGRYEIALTVAVVNPAGQDVGGHRVSVTVTLQ